MGSTNNYSIGGAHLYWMGTSVAASTNALYLQVKNFSATNSFGNITAAEITPDITYLDHYISVNGNRRKDKTVAVTKSISIPFTFDEINATNLSKFLYSSSAGGTKYIVMGTPNVPAEGTAVLFFTTDVGNDFMYVVPKCALKADGGLAFNAEDWMTGKFVLEVLHDANYNASGTTTKAPYGFIDTKSVATSAA
jgi:hypothetical protein